VRITDPDGKVTRYFYDAEDRTTRMQQYVMTCLPAMMRRRYKIKASRP